MEPREEKILGMLLQLENTNEQDLAPVAPKQKKKSKCPPESDKNKRYSKLFCSNTPPSNEKTWNQETEEPKCHNYWLDFGL